MRSTLRLYQSDLLARDAEQRLRLHAAIRRNVRKGWILTFHFGDRATLLRPGDRPKWLFLSIDARGQLTRRYWREPFSDSEWSWPFSRLWQALPDELVKIISIVLLVLLALFVSAVVLAYVITRAFSNPGQGEGTQAPAEKLLKVAMVRQLPAGSRRRFEGVVTSPSLCC